MMKRSTVFVYRFTVISYMDMICFHSLTFYSKSNDKIDDNSLFTKIVNKMCRRVESLS